MNLKWTLIKFFYRFDPPILCLRSVVEHFICDARKDYQSVPPDERDSEHIYLDLLVIRDWLDDDCDGETSPEIDGLLKENKIMNTKSQPYTTH